MLFRLWQHIIALAKGEFAAGASTALSILLLMTVSLPFGLMGATLGFLVKKMIAILAKNVDWIEYLSKRGINRA